MVAGIASVPPKTGMGSWDVDWTLAYSELDWPRYIRGVLLSKVPYYLFVWFYLLLLIDFLPY